MANQWGIPRLHVAIEKTLDIETVQYRWNVTLIAPDATGTRSLGYRRSGHLAGDLVGITFDGTTAVHDWDRDVWTPMNPTDRKDIQSQITNLVYRAATKMHDKGENSFECNILDA
jgi:hypothetical protein